MKKFLSVVMALAMTLTLVTVGASAKDFTDNSAISYDEAVGVISGIGVVDGYTDGSFNPTATLTRGAAAKIICNMLLGPTAASALGVTSAPYSDVPVSNVFAGYIAYCSSQGIINGYSDGTFKPAATVTGFQFLKMLLGALGYDGTIEGFTGTNWAVNVAKLAITTSLTSGNDSFVGSKAMTREEAALYAFNTLKATMVYYPSKGTTISTSDGTTIVTGAVAASSVLNGTGSGYKTGTGAVNDSYMQFCEQYFSKLKLDVGTAADTFGRPASTWEYKSTEIGKYADSPVATFTASTKASAIATALKGYYLPTASSTYVKVENDTAYYTNSTTPTSFNTDTVLTEKGFASPATALTVGDTVANGGMTTAAALKTLTANGTLVQVFADDNKDITAIVAVQYTLGKVTSVTTTSSKTTYAISLGAGAGSYIDYSSDSASTDTINLAGSIAKGDYVTYVKVGSVLYVYPTTTVTGTQTSKNTDDVITVSGTSYTLGTGLTNVSSSDYTNGSTAANYYVDQYGFVVNTTASAAYGDYAFIVGTYGTMTTTVDGKTASAQVKAVLADGTVGTYDLKLYKLTTSDVADGATYDNDNVTTAGTATVAGVGATTHTTFAVGDYVIDGTNVRVYDKTAGNSESSINISSEVASAVSTAMMGTAFGYSLSGTTMTVQSLTPTPANLSTMTDGDVYYAASISGLYDNLTSKTVNTDKTVVINSNTVYVVYSTDKGTATVYTGNTGLPSSVTSGASLTGNIVMKASGTTSATASVIFVSQAAALGSSATENYVYIDATTYSTSLNSSNSTVYTYTGYQADGTTISLTDDSQLATSASGVYKVNSDGTVGDALISGTTDTTTTTATYLYDSALTLSDSMLGTAAGYFNVTDDTQVVYVDSSLGAVDGNGGYVVRAVSSDGTVTANVATIFVTAD